MTKSTVYNLQLFRHSIPNLQLTFCPNLQSTKKVTPPLQSLAQFSPSLFFIILVLVVTENPFKFLTNNKSVTSFFLFFSFWPLNCKYLSCNGIKNWIILTFKQAIS